MDKYNIRDYTIEMQYTDTTVSFSITKDGSLLNCMVVPNDKKWLGYVRSKINGMIIEDELTSLLNLMDNKNIKLTDTNLENILS